MIDNSELRRIIGENVRRLRRDKGWTQTELAERASIQLVHVNRIENGKSSPSAEVLFSLADALGVKTDTLRQLCVIDA